METAQSPARDHQDGAVIDIRVRPSSSRRGLEGLTEGRVVICVHSPPEGGKANREALKLLSGALGVPPSRLEVVRGQSSRAKTVLVRGLSPAEVLRLLGWNG